jgi:hypothetical protein
MTCNYKGSTTVFQQPDEKVVLLEDDNMRYGEAWDAENTLKQIDVAQAGEACLLGNGFEEILITFSVGIVNFHAIVVDGLRKNLITVDREV